MALVAALGGALASGPAHAASAVPSAAARAVAPAVSITPTSGDEMSVFRGTGTGFTPGSSVSVAITVTANGKTSPYTGSYTRTHTADANGSFDWAWIWTDGDPYGVYSFTFTDTSQRSAGVLLTIANGAAPSPATGTQLMIDAASAPPLATLQSWQRAKAPYGAIGIYLPIADKGVDDRHDKTQTNLTPAWVSAVQGGGWHVLPIYVGRQAPTSCQPTAGAFHPMSAAPATALAQGVAAASDAVASANRLGVAAGVPVVYDLEGYRSGCAAAVQAFLLGWTAQLHQFGRLSAVYGTAASAATDLSRAAAADRSYVLPDLFWASTDNRRASTSVAGLPATGWKVANQFLFGVRRSYGGTGSLAVDESAVDDRIWTQAAPSTRADTAAPIVMMAGAPALTRTGKASFAWSAVDAGSGLVSYELRTRLTAGGHRAGSWSAPRKVAARTTGLAALRLKPGEQGCVQVRAVDAAGNVSGWMAPRCTSRLADDRLAKATGASKKRWQHTRRHSAYRRTLTVAKRGGAVLRLGHGTRGRLAVVHSGRGTLVVRVGGRRVGVIRGAGTTWLDLPRAGNVTVTASRAHVAIDGFALTPR